IGRESLNDEMRRWTTGVHWQPYEAGGESELRRGRWVIWEGDEALAAGLSTQLQQLGNFVSRIPLAQLDASADTHRTVLSDAIDEDTVAVVFAPAFDIDAVEEGPRLCTRLARLVALASAREPNQSLRLFVLTRGVAAIGDPRLPVSMTGALLQGMMRTVGYEHAALLPTTVDLGADGPL